MVEQYSRRRPHNVDGETVDRLLKWERKGLRRTPKTFPGTDLQVSCDRFCEDEQTNCKIELRRRRPEEPDYREAPTTGIVRGRSDARFWRRACFELEKAYGRAATGDTPLPECASTGVIWLATDNEKARPGACGLGNGRDRQEQPCVQGRRGEPRSQERTAQDWYPEASQSAQPSEGKVE